jgi:hypothetical protein
MNELLETAQSSVTMKRGLRLDHSDRGKPERVGTVVGRSCIFTYHEILPTDSSYLYRVTNSVFENHVSFICSVSNNSLGGILPQVTFDDGHRSNYENAFPILDRFGVKATFFVLAGRVGSNTNYISWEQAREMALAGHLVASHGWSHRMLTQCSSSELEQEVAHSKREIEDRLGVEVISISAPGGRWDERVVDACNRSGYKYLFHSNPWADVGPRTGTRLRGRHMVTGRMNSQQLQKLMQISSVERQYLRARYAAKERVRLMLGDQLYHRLWCWMANWSPGEGMELEVDGRTNPSGESKTL